VLLRVARLNNREIFELYHVVSPQKRHLRTIQRFLYGEDFIPHEMQADYFGPSERVGKMARDSIFYHGAQVRQIFALGENGMPKRVRHKTAICLILANFENNFVGGHLWH
jgi:hypothetical protein